MFDLQTIEGVLSEIRPEFAFAESQDFICDGMLDSLDMLMLVSRLEQVGKVSIRGVDIVPENFRSLAAIHELMNRYEAEAAGRT